MNSKLALILTLSSLAVIFIVQNTTFVEVNFIVWHVSMPSALLIFFTLLTGFVLGWFLHGYITYRKSLVEYEYLR
jgi:uncharacterized integral membrane protein